MFTANTLTSTYQLFLCIYNICDLFSKCTFVFMSERDLENFLTRHPVTLPERDSKYVAVLLSDSKGKRLKYCDENIVDFPLEYLCTSGSTTLDCKRHLESKLPEIEAKYKKPAFVYVWTGTCDITKRSKGGAIEIRQSGEEIPCKVVEAYNQIKDYVLKRSGRIKFIGVPVYSVSIYNRNRAKHTSDNWEADREVSLQVAHLNNSISTLNNGLGRSTLKFNADVIKCHKKKNTTNFKLLSDGLHPGQLLTKKWLRKLQIDIVKNCFTSNQDIICLDPQELLEFELQEGQ